MKPALAADALARALPMVVAGIAEAFFDRAARAINYRLTFACGPASRRLPSTLLGEGMPDAYNDGAMVPSERFGGDLLRRS
jgi:hypothetical protein